MTQTRQEILEQSAVLARVITENRDLAVRCAEAIREADIRCCLIAARGTSDNAATYAKYLLGAQNRLLVGLAAPTLYTFYQSPPRLRNALVIGVSQSGASTDIVSVLKDARDQGALTVGITNTEDSPLARVSDFVLPCLAGEEKAVAATKTYTSELACIALLSAALAEDSQRLDELKLLPGAVEQAMALEAEAESLAQRYSYAASALVLSRGYNLATAFEIALKMKELTYAQIQAYSTADFMHGPLASVSEGFPVIAVATSGALYENLMESLGQVKERGADLLVISDREEARALGRFSLAVPSVPEWISPIVNIIPGQWLAHSLALSKGFDPDRPRALRKITLTV